MRNRWICPFLFAVVLFSTTVPVSADFSKPSKNLSNDYWGWDTAADIAAIPGTNKVFALWTRLDSDLERERVKFSKSNDGGVTWSSPIGLNCNDFWWWDNPNYWEMYGAAMAVDDPNIHVVMSFSKTLTMEYEIYYRRSVDLGETWEPWVLLTNSSSPSVSPDVAAGGGYVHIVYVAGWPGNWEIMYKRISANGAGPVDQTRRLTFSIGNSLSPSLALSSNGLIVNVVYEDDTSGTSQILYKRLPNSGAGAMETRFLTFGSDDKYAPSIATSAGADDQYVFVVYLDSPDPASYEFQSHYKRLDQFGAAGGNVITTRLTSLPAHASAAEIAFDGSTNTVSVICLAGLPYENEAVFYKKLADYGGNGAITERVSYGSGRISCPCVAAADGWAYVIWSDYAPGDGIPEIFFKRGN